MKWRGINKLGEVAWKPLPMLVDRAAMAVLSQQVCTTISMPACIRAALIATEIGAQNGSSNGASPPIQITLRGGLVIGGLGVELIFRGRPKRPSGFPRDVTTKATLLPGGSALEIHDKTSRAKIGGDPAAWVQIRDGEGVLLTDPTFSCLVTAETYVSPVGISSPAESDLTLTGEMTFDRGLTLRVVLRRREGPLWWGRRPDAVLDFDIVSAGHMVHFPAQPVWTGESVGTLRSLIFLDGEGEPIGNEHLLKPTVALQ